MTGRESNKSLQSYNSKHTGRSGLSRGEAYYACLTALRAGESPLALADEYGEWAVREAVETHSAATADLQDMRQEVVQSLRRDATGWCAVDQHGPRAYRPGHRC